MKMGFSGFSGLSCDSAEFLQNAPFVWMVCGARFSVWPNGAQSIVVLGFNVRPDSAECSKVFGLSVRPDGLSLVRCSVLAFVRMVCGARFSVRPNSAQSILVLGFNVRPDSAESSKVFGLGVRPDGVDDIADEAGLE
ncbi:hypothetical protein LR48_Vigan10g261100 [Vigna angularis]|uniref:Uncharacterized protein n=1 Tax=Phaseolus angularis TaxID=3914 RepID=A0A0L9VPP2_PHAAN|nr:hypothetical protein LR48_Vigan10g261100 [Vigna angularis]